MLKFILVHAGMASFNRIEDRPEGKRFYLDGNSYLFTGPDTPTTTLRDIVQRLMPKDHFPAESAADLVACDERLRHNSNLLLVWVGISDMLLRATLLSMILK